MAFVADRGDEDGGPDIGTLYALEDQRGSAARVVRAGRMQAPLPRNPEPILVRVKARAYMLALTPVQPD